jgi:hypothetical protein
LDEQIDMARVRECAAPRILILDAGDRTAEPRTRGRSTPRSRSSPSRASSSWPQTLRAAERVITLEGGVARGGSVSQQKRAMMPWKFDDLKNRRGGIASSENDN